MARNIKTEQHLRRATQTESTVPTSTLTDAELLNSDTTLPNMDSAMEVDMDDSKGPSTGGISPSTHLLATKCLPMLLPDGLKVLGRGVQQLVQEVQKLRHLGIEDLGLPLPKIVVVGDQSTGKSSLIEGMSEIKVPRSTGTCTRCPTEINLAQDASHTWRCKVTIHKKYMYMGQLGTSKASGKNVAKFEGATRARPLGPWMPQESDDYEFATITSASEVPNVLFLAQLAVLNPRDRYEEYAYVPGKARSTQEPQVKFSPNVVRLDISGRDLPNLSFFDLPGVINVADLSEDAYLVDLVKNLVREYVMAEDCINLLAITMTDDPANSSASKLLRDLKVDQRTVGCLTKPDRLMDDESLDQWVQILRGQSFQLGHGYYVIKNNKDPHVDHATARREEADFFSQEEPWTSVLLPYHKQFGTLQLQAALSDLLTMQIQKRYWLHLLYLIIYSR